MSSLSSLSSHPSTSSGQSIPDPATDMPTVWIPLQDDGAKCGQIEDARKSDTLRWIATALFFVGGLALLALLIIQMSGF